MKSKPKIVNRVIKSIAPTYELPTAPKEAMRDFYKYVSLIYGRQGIGKSTFAASFPNALMLSCERVSRGISCFDFNADKGGVKNWNIMRAAVDLLCKQPSANKFGTIAIDTVEAAYQHCLRWICKRAGVEHPHDMNDYGKTWDAIRNEFATQMDRLWGAGYGIVFTAHSAEVEYTTHSGAEYTRIQPAVTGQALKYLKAKTDCILYAEYVKGADGKTRRVLITEGDEVVEAKHPGTLPRYLSLQLSQGAALVARAFRGEAVGLKESEVSPARTTSGQAAKMIERTRVGAIGVPTKKAKA